MNRENATQDRAIGEERKERTEYIGSDKNC